jgi:hypothetical protein
MPVKSISSAGKDVIPLLGIPGHPKSEKVRERNALK